MHFKDPGRIKMFFKDANKKNFLVICREVLVLWVTKKEVPLYYFKHLYKKDIRNYRDYLAPKEVRRIHACAKLHRKEYNSILHNKLSFALYCERSHIPSPALISYNFKSRFFFKDAVRKISDLGGMVAFYQDVFESIDAAAIFFRPLSLRGGRGCFKIDRENFSQQLRAEFENLLNGDYTHTEVIHQHCDIDRIYDKSINTLRILTFMEGDNVEIVSSIIRIGTGGSFVDNASSGGLFVGIHQETGTLMRTGYRHMRFGGGGVDRHPDTGFVFENFKVPFFKEACQAAMDAVRRIPDPLIGWDIALTPTGPTIIEGNSDAGFFMSDVAYGGLLKNAHMKRIISVVK
ncbi:MAG TPA: sugar-transfer associated ATP-grasp domain-containing protein [Pricia sp.]|nr:sugar-transfer associated ATP-grasp domain-containing protein [Pricia sp.]